MGNLRLVMVTHFEKFYADLVYKLRVNGYMIDYNRFVVLRSLYNAKLSSEDAALFLIRHDIVIPIQTKIPFKK